MWLAAKLPSSRIDELATDAWANVGTNDGELVVSRTRQVFGERRRPLQVFENVFRNTIEYGGGGVTVKVRPIEVLYTTTRGGSHSDADGFIVEDDGDGLPKEESLTRLNRGRRHQEAASAYPSWSALSRPTGGTSSLVTRSRRCKIRDHGRRKGGYAVQLTRLPVRRKYASCSQHSTVVCSKHIPLNQFSSPYYCDFLRLYLNVCQISNPGGRILPDDSWPLPIKVEPFNTIQSIC